MLCDSRRNYFNTIPYQGHRDPSLGELCWQAFTSLAFGARGLLWFTYWDDPDGAHYGYGNSVITRRAVPGTYKKHRRTFDGWTLRLTVRV